MRQPAKTANSRQSRSASCRLTLSRKASRRAKRSPSSRIKLAPAQARPAPTGNTHTPSCRTTPAGRSPASLPTANSKVSPATARRASTRVSAAPVHQITGSAPASAASAFSASSRRHPARIQRARPAVMSADKSTRHAPSIHAASASSPVGVTQGASSPRSTLVRTKRPSAASRQIRRTRSSVIKATPHAASISR